MNNINPIPFEPTLDREFDHTDRLRVYFEVVRKDEKPTVSVTMTVVGADSRPLMAFDKQVTRDSNGKIVLVLPLDTLGRGAYRLRVTATDGSRVATSESGFLVR